MRRWQPATKPSPREACHLGHIGQPQWLFGVNRVVADRGSFGAMAGMKRASRRRAMRLSRAGFTAARFSLTPKGPIVMTYNNH